MRGAGRRHDQRGDPAGVDRPHVDLGDRELDVQVLAGVAQRLEAAAGQRHVEDRLPDLGQAPLDLVADRLGGDDGVVELVEQPVGALEQGLTRDRELDAVGRATQQVAADEAFERADLAAEGRLGQVEAGGGPAEVELLGHGHERPQVAQLDPVGRRGEGQDRAGRPAGAGVVHGDHCDRDRAGAVMHLAHGGHAHSVIPSRASRGDGAPMPPTGPVPPPRPSTYQPARLHLRGATGTVSAQLAWPAPGASSPGLLVFLAGDPPEGQAPAPAVGLARRVGAAGALVVLALAAGSVGRRRGRHPVGGRPRRRAGGRPRPARRGRRRRRGVAGRGGGGRRP